LWFSSNFVKKKFCALDLPHTKKNGKKPAVTTGTTTTTTEPRKSDTEKDLKPNKTNNNENKNNNDNGCNDNNNKKNKKYNDQQNIIIKNVDEDMLNNDNNSKQMLPIEKIRYNSKDGRPSLIVSIELDILNMCTNLLGHMAPTEPNITNNTSTVSTMTGNGTSTCSSNSSSSRTTNSSSGSYGVDSKYNKTQQISENSPVNMLTDEQNHHGQQKKQTVKPDGRSTVSVAINGTSEAMTGNMASNGLKRTYNDETSLKQQKKQKTDLITDSSQLLTSTITNSLNNINSNINNNNSLFTNNNANSSANGSKQVSIGTNTSNTKLTITSATVNPTTTAIVKPMHHGDTSLNKPTGRATTLNNVNNKPKLGDKFDFMET
jgi:hypothetical protein